MKHILLIAATLLAGAGHAQLVQSGFENWTAGAPDGWLGSRSNIGAENVTQVSDNPHGGSFAANLHVVGTSHKRFTTQPVTVANNVSYTVNFWARGTGSIRVGLYDGRTTGAGYASYSGYTTASATWTQITQVITAANDTAGAEFILSVVGTDTQAADVVVDDVNITEGITVQPVSIYDIQFTTDPLGNSPLNGQLVLTGGIVSAIDTMTSGSSPTLQNVYYIQDAPGAWNGIYVFEYIDSPNHPQIGDSIILSGQVDEYFGLTELKNIASYETVMTGLTPHAPLDIQTGELAAEALESVLVRVMDASCTEVPGGANFGKWTADDGSGPAKIGKEMYTTTPDPTLGQTFNVTGIVSYSSFQGVSEYNIQPRMASDVEFASGIAEAGVLATVSMSPNPAKDILNVELGKAAGSHVEYTLIDMQGRTVLEGVFTNERGQVNVGGMPAGMYHITLRSNALVKTFALQVAH